MLSYKSNPKTSKSIVDEALVEAKVSEFHKALEASADHSIRDESARLKATLAMYDLLVMGYIPALRSNKVDARDLSDWLQSTVCPKIHFPWKEKDAQEQGMDKDVHARQKRAVKSAARVALFLAKEKAVGENKKGKRTTNGVRTKVFIDTSALPTPIAKMLDPDEAGMKACAFSELERAAKRYFNPESEGGKKGAIQVAAEKLISVLVKKGEYVTYDEIPAEAWESLYKAKNILDSLIVTREQAAREEADAKVEQETKGEGTKPMSPQHRAVAEKLKARTANA